MLESIIFLIQLVFTMMAERMSERASHTYSLDWVNSAGVGSLMQKQLGWCNPGNQTRLRLRELECQLPHCLDFTTARSIVLSIARFCEVNPWSWRGGECFRILRPHTTIQPWNMRLGLGDFSESETLMRVWGSMKVWGVDNTEEFIETANRQRYLQKLCRLVFISAAGESGIEP